MQLDVVLPLRDQAGLDTFLSHVTNPADPLYRHFLNPSEFATKFGPAQSDYDTLVAFLKQNGFNVYGGTFLGHEVQVTAPVSVIEATFHVTMTVYQHPTESRTFFMPDREPTTSLPFPLWHISGLDNFSIPKPKLINRDQYAAAHGGLQPEDSQPRAGSGGSGPSGSFTGSDMRAAYYGTGPLTGAGQTLGLFEYLGTNLVDLTTYFTNIGQTNSVPVTLRSSDGTSIDCLDTKAGGNCDDGEQSLDMTQAIGMAPGLANLIMFVGNLDTAIISDMTTHYPLSTSIGCSWGWTPADASTLDPYFQQMAAQGQNFFVASGDDSTWKKTGNAEAWPSDDIWIVGVGGTDLVTATPSGPWASETAWSDSGGGISPDAVAIPTYQTAAGIITTTNAGSTTLRNGPDVSANANFTFYTCADLEACQANYYGGTSFAAPMWAGFLALANQQLVANGGSSVGFINPLIYAENLTPATYAANFHDITSGKSGSYTSTTGYDLVTGWGSPTVSLIPTLVATPISTPDFFLTSPSTSFAGVISGTNVTDAVDITSRYGFTGAVALACTATGGMTCTVSAPSATLTSNATVTTPVITINTNGVTVKGTYTATVTGTGSSGLHLLAISVTVSGLSTTAGFNLTAASPTLAPPVATTTFTDTITAASVASFAGSVAFTCTAEGGITCSFSPTPVTLAAGGTGTTVLTLISTAVKSPGTYNVVVTATSGTTINTLTIPVSIILTDFSITMTTTALTPTTATFTDTVNLQSLNTFAGAVTYSCVPVGGLTCSFTPTTSTLTSGGTGTTTMNMSSAGVTVAGTYYIVVSGTSGTVIHSVLVSVKVVLPDFTIAAAPTTLTPTAATFTDTINLAALGTFASTVNLTCVGAGGITCSLSPAAPALALLGTATSTLTMNSTGVTTPGTYNVVVTGTSGTLVHTATVAVTIASAPNFTLAAASTAITPTSTSFTDNITATSTNAFVGTVTYTCTAAGGITCSLAPNTSTLASGGTAISILTMVSTGVTACGTYNVVVTGTSGTLVQSVTIAVTVCPPSFTMSAASLTLTAPTLTDVMTLTSVGGFAGSPALTCTATGGLTCSFAPTSVTLAAGATGTSTLTVAGTGNAGTYSVVVTGTSGTSVQTVTISVIVPSIPTFILATTATTITIASQGASGSTAMALTSANSFAGAATVTCAITASPQGATYIPTCSTTSPISITATVPGTGTLNINTTAQTLSAVQTKPVAWLAGGLLFALLLLPSRRRRWSMLATLFVSALLIGSMTGCASGSTAVTGTQQTYSGGTSLGNYTVTVTAVSGTITKTATVTVIVQ